MAVKIGHAYSDENKSAQGGIAGDQTGNEVKTQNWYKRSKGWSTVFRPKNSAVAEKIATAMEQACANNKIGYDQSQRTTLYAKAKAARWDLSKITAKCECDCSSLVAVCVNAAGIAVSKDMYTGNQKAVLKTTGQFEVLTDSKYLTYDKYLKRGDILLGTGHTAVVLSDGDYAKASDTNALDVDGKWGKATTKRLQQIFGTTVDGEVSNQYACYKDKNPGLRGGWEWVDKPNGKGSQLIKAMQKWAGMPASEWDGEIGTKTIKAFQRKLGTTVDGEVSNPSQMVKALQRWANKQ